MFKFFTHWHWQAQGGNLKLVTVTVTVLVHNSTVTGTVTIMMIPVTGLSTVTRDSARDVTGTVLDRNSCGTYRYIPVHHDTILPDPGTVRVQVYRVSKFHSA